MTVPFTASVTVPFTASVTVPFTASVTVPFTASVTVPLLTDTMELLLLVQSSFSEGVIIGRKRASEIWRGGGGLFSGRFIFVYLRYLRTIIRTKTASSLSFIAKVNTFVSITYHYKIST